MAVVQRRERDVLIFDLPEPDKKALEIILRLSLGCGKP
jgi:hypothetical protein